MHLLVVAKCVSALWRL